MNKSSFVFCLFFIFFPILCVTDCPSHITALPDLPVPAPQNLPTTTCSATDPNFPSGAALALSGYMPFVFINNTDLDDSDIYITVMVNTLTQFLKFENDGSGNYVGTITDLTASTYLSSPYVTGGLSSTPNYTYALSDFPLVDGTDDQYVVYLPNTGNTSTSPSTVMSSSRIFISLKRPLTYFIDYTGTLQTPPEFAVTDNNYYTLNDKIEFDVGSNGHNRLTLNLTGVDFFGLPILARCQYQFLYGSSYHSACVNTGMPTSVSLATVHSNYATALTTLESPFDSYYEGLIAKYTNPPDAGSTVCNLRIFAPATAMSTANTQSQTNPTPVSFPTGYFSTAGSCQWLNAVWIGTTGSKEAYYADSKHKRCLILDATTTEGTGIATGIEQDDGSFSFTITGSGTSPYQKSYSMYIPKPTSSQAIFTGAVSEYTPAITGTADAKMKAQVFKCFSASILCGVIPIDCGSGITIGNTYVQSQSAHYFQNNQILQDHLNSCTCVSNTPWCDFYSRQLLTTGDGNLFYTSAYSDFLGTDGTMTVTDLAGENAEMVMAIYLGDCSTDVNFPNPYAESTAYTFTIGIPHNQGGSALASVYYSTDGGAHYTEYTSGTFSANFNDVRVKISYINGGNYVGQGPFVTQVAPILGNGTDDFGIFYPDPPLSGNITVDETAHTCYISVGA